MSPGGTRNNAQHPLGRSSVKPPIQLRWYALRCPAHNAMRWHSSTFGLSTTWLSVQDRRSRLPNVDFFKMWSSAARRLVLPHRCAGELHIFFTRTKR